MCHNNLLPVEKTVPNGEKRGPDQKGENGQNLCRGLKFNTSEDERTDKQRSISVIGLTKAVYAPANLLN